MRLQLTTTIIIVLLVLVDESFAQRGRRRYGSRSSSSYSSNYDDGRVDLTDFVLMRLGVVPPSPNYMGAGGYYYPPPLNSNYGAQPYYSSGANSPYCSASLVDYVSGMPRYYCNCGAYGVSYQYNGCHPQVEKR